MSFVFTAIKPAKTVSVVGEKPDLMYVRDFSTNLRTCGMKVLEFLGSHWLLSWIFGLVYFNSGGLTPPTDLLAPISKSHFLNYLQSKAKIFRPQLLKSHRECIYAAKRPETLNTTKQRSPLRLMSHFVSKWPKEIGKSGINSEFLRPHLAVCPGSTRDQKPVYCKIKSGHTETTRDSLLFGGFVTLHARLFNTLFSKSLMEIGSFSKYNDELCRVKGAFGARIFSSLCPTNQGPRSNGERSDF